MAEAPRVAHGNDQMLQKELDDAIAELERQTALLNERRRELEKLNEEIDQLLCKIGQKDEKSRELKDQIKHLKLLAGMDADDDDSLENDDPDFLMAYWKRA